jgi:hypothetical protein
MFTKKVTEDCAIETAEDKTAAKESSKNLFIGYSVNGHEYKCIWYT